ncbi:hypothetical protein ACP4OV_020438 [Aristida adscensionis]
MSLRRRRRTDGFQIDFAGNEERFVCAKQLWLQIFEGLHAVCNKKGHKDDTLVLMPSDKTPFIILLEHPVQGEYDRILTCFIVHT